MPRIVDDSGVCVRFFCPGSTLRRVANQLDGNRVPSGLAGLIPFAQRWGTGDDFVRSSGVQEAELDDLRAFVDAVDAAKDEVLYGWLAGPESFDPHPSDEYIAFTNMTMAADEARIRLQRAE